MESLEETIYSVLCAAGQRSRSSAALLGISRKILHHHGLVEQIEHTVESLNQAGIGRGDKLAIVLANGPDAASCCLAVAAAATAAPLNI